MKRLRVAVLMGGMSAERDVSFRSGQVVVQALANTGALVSEVDVQGTDFELPSLVDVVFVALHGTFGEDGQVQRILEQRGVPYTGSGVEASALAFDKAAAKAVFVDAGIPTPAYAVVDQGTMPPSALAPPLVVKPARQGSSVGVTIVKDRSELQTALALARRYDDRLIIEQFIPGREFTVGILGNKTLPIVEICTHRAFFDYHAKYTAGAAEEIVPAALDPLTALRIQDLARQAHDGLGCRDFSRVDVMASADRGLFVLEVNTIPGLTTNSLFPKAAHAAGLSIQDLCARMVEMAMTRRPAAAAVA